MKKKITLMMMVLCFLMSIPLKMMADKVTVHFIDEDGWSEYDAYVFDESTKKSISETNHGWPGFHRDYTTATVNGKKVVTWTIDLLDCTLANARIIFNKRASGSGNQYPESDGWEVQDGLYYYKNGTTSTTPPSGSETGGGSTGGSTPVEWDTEHTNRLTKDITRVYTQGFYLAGNFFSFSGNEVTYDDAVFKFQQQKNKPIGGTDYET